MSHGSLIDHESQKIEKTVLSITVAVLYSFMKCFGSCQFLRGLWMDISGEVANIHMRTDAKNLVTTQIPQEGPFQVMFVETQQQKHQNKLNTRKREGQDSTENTAPGESCIQFPWSVMLISMTPLTWMVRNIPNRTTIEDFTDEIDEAGCVRQYNFFHLLMTATKMTRNDELP